MKEKELRAAATCAGCGKPFGHTGSPLFWRITMERHGVLMRNIQRCDGLAAFLGNTQLAEIMGSSEELTMPVMIAKTVTLCEHCVLHPQVIAQLAECETEDEEPA